MNSMFQKNYKTLLILLLLAVLCFLRISFFKIIYWGIFLFGAYQILTTSFRKTLFDVKINRKMHKNQTTFNVLSLISVSAVILLKLCVIITIMFGIKVPVFKNDGLKNQLFFTYKSTENFNFTDSYLNYYNQYLIQDNISSNKTITFSEVTTTSVLETKGNKDDESTKTKDESMTIISFSNIIWELAFELIIIIVAIIDYEEKNTNSYDRLDTAADKADELEMNSNLKIEEQFSFKTLKLYQGLKEYRTNKFFIYILFICLQGTTCFLNVSIINICSIIFLLGFLLTALLSINDTSKLDVLNYIYLGFFSIMNLVHYSKNLYFFKNESTDFILGFVDFRQGLSIAFFILQTIN